MAAPQEQTRLRGPAPATRYEVAGRNRLELRTGMWRTGGSGRGVVMAGESAADLVGGIQYTRFFKENWAMTFGLEAAGVRSGAMVSSAGVFSGAAGILALPVGAFQPAAEGRSAACRGQALRRRRNRPRDYRVHMPDMRAVMASAGSHVQMTEIRGPHMTADLSGGATLQCSGEMEHFELRLSGGSHCDASELHSRRVTATMSGGSSAIVHAIESLVVDASSGSICEYLGNPSVQAHMSGAGRVRRR